MQCSFPFPRERGSERERERERDQTDRQTDRARLGTTAFVSANDATLPSRSRFED